MNQEPPKSRARVSLGATALGITAIVVLVATLWPTPLDQGYGDSIERFLGVLHRNGIPVWFGYNKLEFTANILMFIPVGFLVALLLPVRAWWLALIICPGISIGIELTQATFLSARFATATDVVSNSLGALIGITLSVALRAVIYARDQRVIERAMWERGARG